LIPEFLAIGHVTRDLVNNGFGWGGTVTYGALTAQKMGLSPAIVTSMGEEHETPTPLRNIPFHKVPASETTTFRNIYQEGSRTQILKGISSPISAADIPTRWANSPLVLLGPVVGEVSYDIAPHFPNSTVVACMQGWLRRWDAAGRVTTLDWDGSQVLPLVDAAVVSTEDVEDTSLFDQWAKLTPVLVVTNGRRGSRVHFSGQWHEVLPFDAKEFDQTGAGDVFATAYLFQYHRSGDPVNAARFASCAAAMSVEAESYSGIPSLAEVEARIVLEQD
jgi:hypothetical protein